MAAILSALAELPKIASLVEMFASAVTAWYLSTKDSNQLSSISDSIALTASAKTDQDRFNAMASLQKTLSAPRIING